MMAADFASEALSYLAERSVAFAVVFLVVGSFWLLMRRWLSSHTGSLLFLLPLVVLVLPVERWIPNPWSSANPIESAALAVLPDQLSRSFVDPTTEGFLDFGNRTAPDSNAAQPVPASVDPALPAPSGEALVSLAVLAMGLWVLGMAYFLVRLMRGQRAVPELLASATKLDDSDLQIDMQSLRRSAGVTHRIELFESPEFESPAIWTGAFPLADGSSKGSTFAALVLPEGLIARLDPQALRWVLLHELAHLARRDHLAELVQRVLGAAFFFHPLVWVANRISRSYREMACDDAALTRCARGDQSRCARALLEVVAHASALACQPRPAHRTPHAMPTLFHSKELTKKRIMRLAEPNRSLTRGLSMAALFPVLLASAAALSAARFPAVSLQQEADEDLSTATDHDEAELVRADSLVAATRATDWLLRVQEDNGGWSYKAPQVDGSHGWLTGDLLVQAKNRVFKPYHSDVALTALAVQALVRRREVQPDNSQVAAAIQSGVLHLIKQQDPESGLFGTKNGSVYMVGQALATEAIAKASAGDRLSADREAALKLAVQFLTRARNPYGAWRYDSPPLGDNDTRITGYVLLALVASAEVNVYAAPEEFASGMSYMAESVDSESGRTHYMSGVEFALRIMQRQESHPAERAEVPTAMHMRLLNSAGLANLKPDDQSTQVEILVDASPLWSKEHGTIDFTYWWQATEAMTALDDAGLGGLRWRQDLRNALLDHQVTSGDMSGTWPSVDAWSAPGMEVYTTATCALALFADCLSE